MFEQIKQSFFQEGASECAEFAIFVMPNGMITLKKALSHRTLLPCTVCHETMKHKL